nr:hypothetical protein [uncultured Rhodopila sp.]
MSDATSEDPRNFRGFCMTMACVSELTLRFLAREYGERRHAAKQLAVITGTSPRTCENWLDGLNAPSLDRFADLAAEHPELEQEFLNNIHARRLLRQRGADAAESARQRLAQRP